jgi:hypothetical protein
MTREMDLGPTEAGSYFLQWCMVDFRSIVYQRLFSLVDDERDQDVLY